MSVSDDTCPKTGPSGHHDHADITGTRLLVLAVEVTVPLALRAKLNLWSIGIHWYGDGDEVGDWLDGIDVDLTLIETRDNPDEPWTRRALAGASVGVEPLHAYEEATELVEAVGLIVGGNPQGKAELARILGKRGNDYQRGLWYAVAGRGALSVSADLHWLMEVLASRAAVWLGQQGWGRAVTKQRDPYVTDVAEGPVGRFRASFELGPHWHGIADRD